MVTPDPGTIPARPTAEERLHQAQRELTRLLAAASTTAETAIGALRDQRRFAEAANAMEAAAYLEAGLRGLAKAVGR